VKLPSSIVKKYGISKKAWSIYRQGKKQVRHVSQKVKSMPRRYGYRRYGSFRRRGGRGKFLGLSSRGLLGISGIAAIAAAFLLSDMLANALPVNIPLKDKMVAFALAGPAGVAVKIGKDVVMPAQTATTLL
jgi:hypothetical protein